MIELILLIILIILFWSIGKDYYKMKRKYEKIKIDNNFLKKENKRIQEEYDDYYDRYYKGLDKNTELKMHNLSLKISLIDEFNKNKRLERDFNKFLTRYQNMFKRESKDKK